MFSAWVVCCRGSGIGQCMIDHTQTTALEGITFVWGTLHAWFQ